MVKIDESLYIGGIPALCRVKEYMLGEYWDMKRKIGSEQDYDLALKHNPDVEAFSPDNVVDCGSLKELPPDWKAFAYDVIRKYKLY